jgi:putative selenium metabolism hydrolase
MMNSNETQQECVELLKRFIRTPSLPGQEGELAEIVLEEMLKRGFDHAFIDDAGNVIGTLKGSCSGPSIMFNTHLDHVDAGEASRWVYPPFEGVVADGVVWGRGAVDIKGPLAAQIVAIGSLAREGRRPPTDIFVTVVVQEEVGGLGAIYLSQHLKPDLVVVGEPSSNQLRRGHRGRTEAVVNIRGRSAHASVPHLGVNPLNTASRFLLELEKLQLRADKELGNSTVVGTLFQTDQNSPNVIPGEVWLTCDWRNVPGEDSASIARLLGEVGSAAAIDGSQVKVTIPVMRRSTYTGLEMEVASSHPAFMLPRTDLSLEAAFRVLHRAIGLTSEPGIWRFATDGGHFAKAGMTVIGFGPGDDELAHTVREAIPVSEMEKAVLGYRALAMKWVPEMNHHKTQL